MNESSNAASSILVRSGQLSTSGFKPGLPPSLPLFPRPWFFSTFYLQCGFNLPNPTLALLLPFIHFLPYPLPQYLCCHFVNKLSSFPASKLLLMQCFWMSCIWPNHTVLKIEFIPPSLLSICAILILCVYFVGVGHVVRKIGHSWNTPSPGLERVCRK